MKTDTLDQKEVQLLSTFVDDSIAKKSRPDKEKLQDFIKSLGQITGPEVESKEATEILSSTLHIIHEATLFLTDQIKSI